MPDVIEFLFDKKEFQKIIDFANQFEKEYWVNDKVLFKIAYSYSLTDNKQAKKYYKEYLSTIGENQAVLNNLANIFSTEGDLLRKIYPGKMRVERLKKEQLSDETTKTRTNRNFASPS